jgi:tetratricopeptide (TPR) repeat protein
MPTRSLAQPTTAPADPSAAVRTRVVGRLVRLGYWLLVPGLIGLNGWWWSWDRPRAKMAMIDSWINHHREDEAERELRSLLQQSRFHGDARMKLARLLGKRGDYLACAEELHKVPDWWPTKADALFLEAEAFKRIDRAREAERAWAACLAGDPLHPVPLKYVYGAARELVGIYILESRLDEARQALMKTCEMADPADRPGILILRMQAELLRIRPEEAVKTLRKYVSAASEDWEARRALAREEELSGDPAAADRHIAACLEATPEDPSVWRTWLEILHQRGDREKIRDAMPRMPPAEDDPVLWDYRGLARSWDHDLEGAVEAFSQAVRLNAYEPEYYYHLGIHEMRLGQAERAQAHLQRHRELQDAQNQLDDAVNAFIDVSATGQPGDPAYRAAVKQLASLCDQLGWSREAQAWNQLLPRRPGAR